MIAFRHYGKKVRSGLQGTSSIDWRNVIFQSKISKRLFSHLNALAPKLQKRIASGVFVLKAVLEANNANGLLSY